MTDPRIIFANAQARVFESLLKPLGYAKGKELYVRRTHHQLHGFELQNDERTPGEYFVNLGFSFDFLPPFQHAKNALDNVTDWYRVVDFLFSSRIGWFLPGPHIDAWDYWELDAEGVEALVKKNITDCLRVFERCGQEWAEPRRFLEVFPPELIKADADQRREQHEAEKKKMPWTGTFPLTEVIGKAWRWEHRKLSRACGIIAARSGHHDLAKQYMDFASRVDQSKVDGDYVRFKSRYGLSFVAPSGWTAEQDDSAFTLHAPDGHAVINAFRFDANAEFDSEWFNHTMVGGVVNKSRKWKPIEKSEVTIGRHKAVRRDFFPKPEQKARWRLYTYTTANFHHAILLEATNAAMSQNGEAYENIIRTFDDGE